MSFIDQFEQQPQASRLPILRWAIPLGAVVALWALGTVGAGIFTDWLWFDQLGFLSVYTKILMMKVILFMGGGILFLVVFVPNVYFASRFSPHGVAPEAAVSIPPEALMWARRLVTVGIVAGALLLAVIFGAAAAGSWEVALRFTNAVSFGIVDPQFGRDASYYVFSLPFYRFAQGWLLGIFVVNALAVLGIYVINFAIGGFRFTVTPALRGHLSALGAAIFLMLAAGYWLSVQEIVFSDRAAAYGAGYTDLTIRLPALQLLVALSIGVSLLLAVNTLLKGTILPIAGMGVWLAVLVLGVALLPTLVQRFQVDPSEFDREQSYIARTIDMTRQGFALNRIDTQLYPVGDGTDAATVEQNLGTIENIRLWDHRPLRDVYNQIQFFRLQYSFLDIDIDRYTIDGDYRQVMVGMRELVKAQLPVTAQTWVNRKLQFTHGYGVAMSPVTEFTSDGLPIFLIKDIPPKPVTGAPEVTQPQIYFGEATDDWVIVNSRTPEFDHPTDQESPRYTSYAGDGVKLGGFLRRLLFAWRFSDVNIFVTSEVTPDSQILYYRGIQERVQHVAPFLELDRDPYAVVADGKLWWIQDAYTVSDRFPYSEPTINGFNYIRNSVKAVVDAYDGSLDLYISDPEDGIIQTYAGVFPDLFKPIDEMPESLRSHIRYPEDFFLIQAEKYLKFHMSEPQVFYNQEDLWSFPRETVFADSQLMEPYYLIMRLPDESQEEFVLIMPFTPSNKPNLVGWLAARNDPPHYGSLIAFSFPKERQIDGAQQVEARININPAISQQITLWSRAGSQVLRGNLLVIPVGGTILYVQPLYLQAENLRYPQLTRVILASQGQEPVMESSLDLSLNALLRGGGGPIANTGSGSTPSTGGGTVADQIQAEITRIQGTLSDLQSQLGGLSDRFRELLGAPDPEPSPTATAQ